LISRPLALTFAGFAALGALVLGAYLHERLQPAEPLRTEPAIAPVAAPAAAPSGGGAAIPTQRPLFALADPDGKTHSISEWDGKALVVNFWATWCAPCVQEFPELQKMVRMYRKRDLQVVTVSLNAPDEKAMVEKFLNEEHAINTNLQWNTNDAADAVSAFSAGWNGGLPYTVLIGMNGEILYHSQGSFDPLDVKRAILRNLPDDRYIGQHAYWNSTF
jgi:thiol-disulfide isomerase/thioredoxin